MTTVRDVMSDDCQCIGEDETIIEAAKKLASLDVGSMPICGNDDKLKGMLTDRDIVVEVLAKDKDPASCTAGELGDGPPVWVDADADADEAMDLMSEHQIRRLPVLEDKRLVGIVSQADVARKEDEDEVGETVADISR